MEILILFVSIIIVVIRKYKVSIIKVMKKIFMELAAVILSLILVISLVVTEVTQRLLNKIGKE